MNKRLLEAVEIFKQLGWEKATSETVLELPIGTQQQQQVALAGLKSGEWGAFMRDAEDRGHVWTHYFDVDAKLLALFAVRIGVEPRRAVQLMLHTDYDLSARVIQQRGKKYAVRFINQACTPSNRLGTYGSSLFAGIALRLVYWMELPLPQNQEYLKDWTIYAAASLGLKSDRIYGDSWCPAVALVKATFEDNARACVALGVPVTGSFGEIFLAAAKREWLTRETALELLFDGFDRAVRPGDRKAWLRVMDQLKVSDPEVKERIQLLIPLLSLGENAVISELAPRMIKLADDEELAEVLQGAFSTTTKKGKRLVLSAALKRSKPDHVELLIPWLSMFLTDTDDKVASLADKLGKQWELPLMPMSQEREPLGLWQHTPAIWTMPTFELGELSFVSLSQLAARVVQQREPVPDVLYEQFLGLANALAFQDIESTRTSLQGLRSSSSKLYQAVCWVMRETPLYGFDDERRVYDPISAREYAVWQHLGQRPCLLSTPSSVNLSITLTDLIDRLQDYQERDLSVLESDLMLALMRLDLGKMEKEHCEKLRNLKVPILLQSGSIMETTAGQAVLTYIDHPVQEPFLSPNQYGYWHSAKLEGAASFPEFPDRLGTFSVPYRYALFPHWGDGALGDIKWRDDIYHQQGLVLRQAARRAKPLPAGASINLLAAQRSMAPVAAEDSFLAVTEAWQRGLLRPGIADVSLLDWSSGPPTNLVAFSKALEEIANEGLLSVVWPILDDVIGTSLTGTRLLVGTTEFAELIERFLPEVQEAVASGIAQSAVLNLSATRRLAQRGGTSRGVTIAKKIVKQLPEFQIEDENDGSQKSDPVIPQIEDLWPAEQPPVTMLLEDHVQMSISLLDSKVSDQKFLFTLSLPDITDSVFQIVVKWFYSLENEGQCMAYKVSPETVGFHPDSTNKVWLYWDQQYGRLCAGTERQQAITDELKERKQAPPLSIALLTIIITLMAQDSAYTFYAPSLLRTFVANEQVNERVLRRAAKTILQYPAVNPAKLVRILEKEDTLIHALWPLLAEIIEYSGKQIEADEKIPVWLNRVLGILLKYAPLLKEAANRGLIDSRSAQWPGLAQIAGAKSKSKAVDKAKDILKQLI